MPNVNRQVLEWARKTAGLSLEAAAEALDLRAPARLAAIEAGESEPSRPLLLRMSKQYRRPLLTFYLDTPPRRADRGQDFRTLPATRSPVNDVLVDALIRDLESRQGVVRAVVQDEDDAAALPFVGSSHMEDGVTRLVQSIRDRLSFNLAKFRASRTVDAAFAYLRERAEGAGVFVLLVGNLGSHHSAIPVEVFRGFAIADPFAPFVVINDQDARTAWSFTLLHEVTHLWLGTTGVSGANADTAIEQFCNDVASEILLPRSELQSLRSVAHKSIDGAIQEISEFAQERHISRAMVAYKLHRVQLLSRNRWQAIDAKLTELWLRERAKSKLRERSRESGPSFYVVRRHRLGRALLDLTDRSIAAGNLSPVKAAKVLGVKPRSVFPLLADRPPPHLF